MSRLRFAALAAVFALGAQAASATIVTKTISFTGTNFTPIVGSGATLPIDPAKLSFEVTLDTSADISHATSGFTILPGTNLPFTFEYAYNAGMDFLTVAFDASALACTYGDHGACAFVYNFSTDTPSVGFYAEYVDGTLWSANTITDGLVADVPEPASWAMMLGGFAVLGGALRQRRAAIRFA